MYQEDDDPFDDICLNQTSIHYHYRDEIQDKVMYSQFTLKQHFEWGRVLLTSHIIQQYDLGQLLYQHKLDQIQNQFAWAPWTINKVWLNFKSTVVIVNYLKQPKNTKRTFVFTFSDKFTTNLPR